MFNCFNIFKKKNHKTVDVSYSKFDLNNVKGNFYVDSVYDGDTICILIPTKLSIYEMLDKNTIDLNTNTNPTDKIIINKVRVRLYGIDTPELKPKKDLVERNLHIEKAIKAKNYLSQLILNKIVKVEFFTNDKYGRPLVKLYVKNIISNEICLNELMIKKGYANKYLGSTKDDNFKFVDVEF